MCSSDEFLRCMSLLLAQSGHSVLRIVAAQNDDRTPFRRSQIPAVIGSYTAWSWALGEGNATTRFHQSDYWISRRVADRGARAAGGVAGGWVSQFRFCPELHAAIGSLSQRSGRDRLR